MSNQQFTKKYFGKVTEFCPTEHAALRMAQRNLTLEEVWFVIKHGKVSQVGKAREYWLRAKDIPEAFKLNGRWAQLCGTKVIVSHDEPLIITAWR